MAKNNPFEMTAEKYAEIRKRNNERLTALAVKNSWVVCEKPKLIDEDFILSKDAKSLGDLMSEALKQGVWEADDLSKLAAQSTFRRWSSKDYIEPAMFKEPEPVKQRSVLVYRMQTADGQGLYQTAAAQGMYDIDTTHPSPRDDRALCDFYNGLRDSFKLYDYYFGFASMDQLRRWIYQEYMVDNCREHGVHCHIYQTTDYCIGDTQMMFRKATATHIGSFVLDY